MYNALRKLKDINPLYSEISIPLLPSDLVLDGMVSEYIVDSDPNEDGKTEDETAPVGYKDAML